MKNCMNNPMMDMFKKAMENPMDGWNKTMENPMDGWNKTMEMAQNFGASKDFNPGNWMNMSNKFMENMPWVDQMKGFGGNKVSENMGNVEAFADMNKLTLENAQAMLRRQGEIIQKHSTDIYKLMQNMVSSPNPEAAMSLQTEYVQMAFDVLVSDFKELMEMYSKSHLEAFDNASCKVKEQIHKMKAKACGTKECHTHEDEHDNKSDVHNKKTSKK